MRSLSQVLGTPFSTHFPTAFLPMAASSRPRASQVKTTQVDPDSIPTVDSPIPTTIQPAEKVQNQQDDLSAKLAELQAQLKEANRKTQEAEAKAALLRIQTKKTATVKSDKAIAFSHPKLEETIVFTPKNSKDTRRKSYFFSIFENLRYPIRWAIDKIEESPNDPVAIQVAKVINDMILDNVSLIGNTKTTDMLKYEWVEGEHMVFSEQAKLFRNVCQFAGNYCLVYISFIVAFEQHIKPSDEVIKAISDIREQRKVLVKAKNEEELAIKSTAKSLGVEEESIT